MGSLGLLVRPIPMLKFLARCSSLRKLSSKNNHPCQSCIGTSNSINTFNGLRSPEFEPLNLLKLNDQYNCDGMSFYRIDLLDELYPVNGQIIIIDPTSGPNRPTSTFLRFWLYRKDLFPCILIPWFISYSVYNVFKGVRRLGFKMPEALGAKKGAHPSEENYATTTKALN